MNINFDMDGTIADFYGVDNWLEMLINEDATPYRTAKPLVNLSLLARYIHKVQAIGINVNIISWGSKKGSDEFLAEVTQAKIEWLTKHLPSVEWNEIHIVHYGVPKSSCGCGVLFDDELSNRIEWNEQGGRSYDETEIFRVLKELL